MSSSGAQRPHTAGTKATARKPPTSCFPEGANNNKLHAVYPRQIALFTVGLVVTRHGLAPPQQLQPAGRDPKFLEPMNGVMNRMNQSARRRVQDQDTSDAIQDAARPFGKTLEQRLRSL